ncbi:hypothetical protein MC885_008254 [Smutsia gigantea]|nr:hypothetical protein MC885_008254 [Smutsia gigantea]
MWVLGPREEPGGKIGAPAILALPVWQSTDFLFHPQAYVFFSAFQEQSLAQALDLERGRSKRMFTVTRAIEETLLQHFIHQKLKIAYAIYKPFPFFEALRDNSFISERMYRESLEACGHMVPISRVVYNILTKLENTFNLSLLEIMFSRIHLHEYPDLKMILKSFRNVVTSYGRQKRAIPSLREAPAHSAGESCLQTLALPPPPQHPTVSRRPPWADEPGASAGHSAEILAEPPPPSGPALALPRVAPEEKMVPDNLATEMNEEDSQEMPGTPITSVQVVRDDSPEPNDPKELQEVSSVPPNKKAAASPGHGIQGVEEKLQGVDQATQRKDDSARNSKVMTRAQKARTDCAQTSGPEENKRKKDVCSNLTRSCQKSIPLKEQPKDETMDFHSTKLPVTCGEAKGILYMKKLKKGSSEKCIQNEKGVWFTPKEFEIEGKRASTKYWKQSIRCRGKTLKQLLEEGILVCPPRISLKRKVNSSAAPLRLPWYLPLYM